MERTYLSQSLADTHKLGERFITSIPPGTTVAICGTLGSGKTTFVQGVGIASGINAKLITSPTFVLCNEYVGTKSFFHLDAYRLADSDDFSELGTEEMYQSNHYVFIEWADRVVHSLPREYITIHIDIKTRDSRLFRVKGTAALKQNVQRWMDSISDD